MTMPDLDLEQAIVERLVGLPVADVERDLILATLRETGGNRTHAANLLGIAIRTLRNKINSYTAEGYDVPDPPQPPAASA
jgi:DNA-binding NtrC family response regulator